MSRENVEVVRQGYEAWEEGDLAGVTNAFDESVITHPIIGPTWYGREGVLDMLTDWLDGFEGFTMKAEEFIDAGEHVVVRVRQEAHEPRTGVPVDATFWFVHSVRNGKVVLFRMFQEREAALEAVGLRE